MWCVDSADMKSLSKNNRGIRYLLCAIDLFSKYAQTENQIKYGFIKVANFTIIFPKDSCKTKKLKCIQHNMKENVFLLKDLLEL